MHPKTSIDMLRLACWSPTKQRARVSPMSPQYKSKNNTHRNDMDLSELRHPVLVLLQFIVRCPLGVRLMAHMMFVFGVTTTDQLQLIGPVRVDLVWGVVARGDMGPKATAHVNNLYGGGH